MAGLMITAWGLALTSTLMVPGAGMGGAIASKQATYIPPPAHLPERRPHRPLASINPMAEEILAAHNRYRAELDLPPLVWSDTLASHAQEWADQLADMGGRTLMHSEGSGEGENLWLGTAGAFSYTDMVDLWGAESQYFVNGTFPNVSSTGNWADVGHYTQMIWRNTTEVGCAVATAGGNDILVCRYNPPGNYLRQPVY